MNIYIQHINEKSVQNQIIKIDVAIKYQYSNNLLCFVISEIQNSGITQTQRIKIRTFFGLALIGIL